MRRKKLPPDNRLDWRDPDMPVFNRKGELMPPSWRQGGSDFGMRWGGGLPWRDDPSYKWNRKRKS